MTFLLLCHELSRLQVQLLRREGVPTAISHEAMQALRASKAYITPSVDNFVFVPLLLKSCAALFRHVPENDELLAMELLDAVHELSSRYVHSGSGDVNQLSSVVRSLASLAESQETLSSLHIADGAAGVPFSELLVPAYTNAFGRWKQHRDRPTTLSTLALLQGCGLVHGRRFRFTPQGADRTSLLPMKSKLQMEAKLQRCTGARDLLVSLREMEMNRLDAGMALTTMAEAGLYDAEVCNKSCDVLHASHTLLSSHQLCQVVHSLGVLQHRHIYQKFFSGLIKPKRCDAEGIRRHVVGLAMLRQPPPSETALLDGVFLHALRSTSSSTRADAHTGPSRVSSRAPGAHPEYELPPAWYVDVSYALSCLDIHAYKFKLTTARKVRRAIGKMSTLERCKLLYGIGGEPLLAVPPDLRDAWQRKVERTVSVTVEKLKELDAPTDGPHVTHALLTCGIMTHPRIPSRPTRHTLTNSRRNPVEALLKTWTGLSQERLLELTEQVEPTHFGPDARVASLVTTLANSYGGASVRVQDRYKLGPLCAAVEAHGGDMTVEESLHTLNGLQQMGVADQYAHRLEPVLANLWSKRDSMTDEQLADCYAQLHDKRSSETALRLTEFALANSSRTLE